MMLRDEILPYTDVNELVAPNKCDPTLQGSDNGVLFTSEYYIMLSKMGMLGSDDVSEYEHKVRQCYLDKGLLSRAPGDDDQAPPDDLYGVMAACSVLGCQTLAYEIYSYGLKHFGWYNTEKPGTLKGRTGNWNWGAFQFRQIQLIAAMVAASGCVRWWKVWHIPLFIYASVVILFSCRGKATNDADSRRLAWLLIQATKNVSILCSLASIVWFNRLYSDYPNGMRGVATVYYEPGHPFQKYFVTK